MTEFKTRMFHKIKKQNGVRLARTLKEFMNIPELDKRVRYAGRNSKDLYWYCASLVDPSLFAPLPKGYISIGGMVLKYNYKIDNAFLGADYREFDDVYFGEKFYVADCKIFPLQPHEIMLDYMILDVKTGEISDPAGTKDGFIAALSEEIKGKTLQVKRDKNRRHHLLADGEDLITLDQGKIVFVSLPHVQEIKDGFLYKNKTLKDFFLPMVQKIGRGVNPIIRRKILPPDVTIKKHLSSAKAIPVSSYPRDVFADILPPFEPAFTPFKDDRSCGQSER